MRLNQYRRAHIAVHCTSGPVPCGITPCGDLAPAQFVLIFCYMKETVPVNKQPRCTRMVLVTGWYTDPSKTRLTKADFDRSYQHVLKYMKSLDKETVIITRDSVAPIEMAVKKASNVLQMGFLKADGHWRGLDGQYTPDKAGAFRDDMMVRVADVHVTIDSSGEVHEVRRV